MYQILKREIMHNHAHSDFYQTDYFFISKRNADEKLEELSAEYKGFTFEEVVNEDESGDQILDRVFYDIKDCYKIVEIKPWDEVNDPLPF
jgi:hypothetical protein